MLLEWHAPHVAYLPVALGRERVLSPPKPAEANLVAVLCAVGGDTQYSPTGWKACYSGGLC